MLWRPLPQLALAAHIRSPSNLLACFTQAASFVERKKATLTYFVKHWMPRNHSLALDFVQRRVPLDRLAHAGGRALDERVEAAPEVALPARHGRDVCLHGGCRRWPSRSEGCRLRGGPALRPCRTATSVPSWVPSCAAWQPSQRAGWRPPYLRPSPTSWTSFWPLRSLLSAGASPAPPLGGIWQYEHVETGEHEQYERE